MSPALALCWARLRAAAHADSRAVVSWCILILVSIAGLPRMARGLSALAARWAPLDAAHLDAKLGLAAALLWTAFAGLGALAAGGEGYASRAGRLLALLPIPHACRARALAVQVLTSRLGLLILAVAATSAPAAIRLGARGVAWQLALVAGSTGSAMLGAMAWVAGALLAVGQGRTRWRAMVLALVSMGSLALAILAAQVTGHAGLLGAALLVFAAVALLGAFAHRVGAVVLESLVAFEQRQGKARVYRPSRVAQALARWPGPMGAFLYRGFLKRKRGPFTYIRLALMVGYGAVFPALWSALPRSRFSAPALIAAYVVAGIQLLVLEAMVQTLAGEANRIALVLRSPASMPSLLAARVGSAFVPVAAAGLVLTATAAWASHSGLNAFGIALLAVALISAGSTAFLVLGGAMELDLDQRLDTAIEILFAEEAPVQPRRLVLLGAAAAFQVAELVMVFRWPMRIWAPGLILVDLLIVVAMGRFARRALGQLVESPRC